MIDLLLIMEKDVFPERVDNPSGLEDKVKPFGVWETLWCYFCFEILTGYKDTGPLKQTFLLCLSIYAKLNKVGFCHP